METTTSRRAALLAAVAAPLLLADGTAAKRASGSGSAVARFARRFEGKRYVAAGNTPKHGFDCSGLTMFVVKRKLGMDITQSVAQQWRFGKRVKYGRWEPGDLIFFRNTYRKGLSHVGICLGGNRFIHAQNEDTGVIITDISKSDYYQKHYAGAKRLV